MSQTELDQLIDQLSVGDPKTRRTAAKRLGELGRPEAIAELANVYLKDEDKTVRKAAEESLRVFRKIEQDIQSGDDPTPPASSGGLLLRIRGLLIVLLVLSVLGNAGLFVSKLLPQPVAVTPVQTTITPRDDLMTAFKKRVDDNRTVAVLLRQMYSAVQGMGAQALKVNTPGCEKLQAAQPNKVDLGTLDSATYPDLKDVNDQINVASLRLLSLRNNYVTLCTSKDTNEFNKLLTDQGGAAKQVAEIDDVTNKDLASAETGLKKAIDRPAPTVGPTSTPTTPPTVPPTITPSAAPVTATVPGTKAPAGTAAAVLPTTAASTGAATSAATAVPVVASITFKGLQLDALKSYRYKVAVRAAGTYTNGKTFSGSLQITAARQVSPLIAQYEVITSEVNTPKDLIKNIAGTLYTAGSSSYLILDNVLYQTGNVLDAIRPKVQCLANKVTDKTTPADFAMPDLGDLTLNAQPPDDTLNDVKVQHYHGEKRGGDKNQFLQAVDVFLSADKQLPIRVVETITMPPAAAASGPTAVPTVYTAFSQTIQYDLLSQNQDVKVAKPLVCNDVPVK